MLRVRSWHQLSRRALHHGILSSPCTTYSISTTTHHPLATFHRSFVTASRMSVADLLAVSKEFRSKQTHYIFQDQSLRDAVSYLAKNENSATLVVVNHDHQVVGMVTNHMILERIANMND